MVFHDRLLIGPPLLDDRLSSTIEHDIMRRGAGANRWIVDSCCPEDRAVGCTPTRETAMLR